MYVPCKIQLPRFYHRLAAQFPPIPYLPPMFKDPRYETIHLMLKAKAITRFTAIFEYVPHTVLANEFRTNHNRMKKMVADPALWQLQELYRLADLLKYDKKKLCLMAVEEVEERMGG